VSPPGRPGCCGLALLGRLGLGGVGDPGLLGVLRGKGHLHTHILLGLAQALACAGQPGGQRRRARRANRPPRRRQAGPEVDTVPAPIPLTFTLTVLAEKLRETTASGHSTVIVAHGIVNAQASWQRLRIQLGMLPSLDNQAGFVMRQGTGLGVL
jgi:hypothetical protein